MGKPFDEELKKLHDTFDWAMNLNMNHLKPDFVQNPKLPLLIVGSGGSLSACYYAVQLYQDFGLVAKAVTPLELIYSKNIIRKSNVLFISASGKNTDILNSYKIAVNSEAASICILCMSLNSPLAKLAKTNSITQVIEYSIPVGKDGFLATNSLIAFFCILLKTVKNFDEQPKLSINSNFHNELSSFISKVNKDFTFSVLYAGLGQPVAIDLESKLAEAALADILISDYRNFGHGRHHWFAKRRENSAIIAIITKKEKELALKTLSLIPKSIPILILQSDTESPISTIEILIKSFHFINAIGKIQNIDPGKPGVPDFGRKLYHLSYQKLFELAKTKISESKKLAISRKAGNIPYNRLSEHDRKYWQGSYERFTSKLTSAAYGTIVFDYDGTLCSSSNRFNGIDEPVVLQLKKILTNGNLVGIATGRGQSVRVDLQKSIPKKYWKQIIIGYYNGSDIGSLSDNSLPDKSLQGSSKIQLVYNKLKKQKFITDIVPEMKPFQVTIEVGDLENWEKVRLSIIHFVIELNVSGLQILESSHSLDIVDQEFCNKLNLVDYCSSAAASTGLSSLCLCIGDKGKWPGNDYQLLSSEYSLSCDEVSALENSCWNLAGHSIKNVDATLFYLSCLIFKDKDIKIKLP